MKILINEEYYLIYNKNILELHSFKLNKNIWPQFMTGYCSKEVKSKDIKKYLIKNKDIINLITKTSKDLMSQLIEFQNDRDELAQKINFEIMKILVNRIVFGTEELIRNDR